MQIDDFIRKNATQTRKASTASDSPRHSALGSKLAKKKKGKEGELISVATKVSERKK